MASVTQEKAKIMKELHSKEEAIFVERNEKYGDSFSKTFSEYGPAVALIRLEDKLNRAKNLVANGLAGSDGESLVDTLMDLSNYSNMFIIELQGQATAEAPQKPSKKKRDRKKKEKKAETPEESKKATKKGKAKKDQEPETKEEGPLDSLTKKQLIQVIGELGEKAPNKANREKLYSIINGHPTAKVAVAITAVKQGAEEAEEPATDGEEA